MKKQHLYPLLIIPVFIIVGLVLQSFLHKDEHLSSKTVVQEVRANISIPNVMQFAGEEVPLNVFYVREALEQELIVNTYWHSSTIQLVKRSHRYFPLIDSLLGINGIPLDFKYLCVAESGLRDIVSPSGAAGFWQIMKGTGKEYGLEINADIDERYHLEKATTVACAYLQKAYDEFGSWTLAAASYNAGMNKIRKELERQLENDYYRMNFREETARYVFRILALKQILTNPNAHGFFVKNIYTPLHTRSVSIDTTIQQLGEFAHKLGISYRTLKYYNPWLRTSKLPNKSGKKYDIALPTDN